MLRMSGAMGSGRKIPLETIVQDMSGGEDSPPKTILSGRDETIFPQIMVPCDRASPDPTNMMGRP